jgi:hypothetical protein
MKMAIYPVTSSERSAGIDLFQSTRRKAQLKQLIQRALQRDEPLANFCHLVGLLSKGRAYLGMQVVPLEKITGSLNREGDFDRQFRPLRKHLRDRWVNILLLMKTDAWEPVSLYKVRDTYYVVDGHHRVSVANISGRQFIEAVVWEYAAEKPARRAIPKEAESRKSSLPIGCEECA